MAADQPATGSAVAPSWPKKSFADLFSRTTAIPHSLPITPLDSFKGEPNLTITADEHETLISPWRFSLVGKFHKHGPNMESLRKAFHKVGFKGSFWIGWMDPRHVLIRFDLEEDYCRLWRQGCWIFCGLNMRVFKWTYDFNLFEEPSIVPAWIGFEGLPIHLYNKSKLFSLAQAVRQPLTLDAPTANATRPSVAKVCVELDLLGELPNRIRITHAKTGKGFWQPITYDELPEYCTRCMKIGHGNANCHSNQRTMPVTAVIEKPKRTATEKPNQAITEKPKKNIQSVVGDLRDTILNPKRLAAPQEKLKGVWRPTQRSRDEAGTSQTVPIVISDKTPQSVAYMAAPKPTQAETTDEAHATGITAHQIEDMGFSEDDINIGRSVVPQEPITRKIVSETKGQGPQVPRQDFTQSMQNFAEQLAAFFRETQPESVQIPPAEQLHTEGRMVSGEETEDPATGGADPVITKNLSSALELPVLAEPGEFGAAQNSAVVCLPDLAETGEFVADLAEAGNQLSGESISAVQPGIPITSLTLQLPISDTTSNQPPNTATGTLRRSPRLAQKGVSFTQ